MCIMYDALIRNSILRNIIFCSADFGGAVFDIRDYSTRYCYSTGSSRRPPSSIMRVSCETERATLLFYSFVPAEREGCIGTVYSHNTAGDCLCCILWHDTAACGS